jgi:hypothetical protein
MKLTPDESKMTTSKIFPLQGHDDGSQWPVIVSPFDVSVWLLLVVAFLVRISILIKNIFGP